MSRPDHQRGPFTGHDQAIGRTGDAIRSARGKDSIPEKVISGREDVVLPIQDVDLVRVEGTFIKITIAQMANYFRGNSRALRATTCLKSLRHIAED